MTSAPRRTPVIGSLGLFLGGLGCITSIVLLVLVWRSAFWMQQTTKEVVDGTLLRLENTRTRLLESETRIQTIRKGLEQAQQAVKQRARENLELDGETRTKLLTLSERLQTYEQEIRVGLQRSQALLIMSRESVTGLQTHWGPDRLTRLQERILELEELTASALTKLEKLRAVVDRMQTGLEERKDAHVAFLNAKLDDLALILDEILLEATHAATRSAKIVEAVHEDIHSLRTRLLRIVFQVATVLSVFLLWNFAAQTCLLLTGKRHLHSAT